LPQKNGHRKELARSDDKNIADDEIAAARSLIYKVLSAAS